MNAVRFIGRQIGDTDSTKAQELYSRTYNIDLSTVTRKFAIVPSIYIDVKIGNRTKEVRAIINDRSKALIIPLVLA